MEKNRFTIVKPKPRHHNAPWWLDAVEARGPSPSVLGDVTRGQINTVDFYFPTSLGSRQSGVGTLICSTNLFLNGFFCPTKKKKPKLFEPHEYGVCDGVSPHSVSLSVSPATTPIAGWVSECVLCRNIWSSEDAVVC